MNLYIICCKEWNNFIEDDKYKTLESLREARGFLNGIKGYETDVEFAKRGDEALGWKNGTFVEVLYNYINFKLNGLDKVKIEGTNRRGKTTIAKEKLYKVILSNIREIYPNFNIGISTSDHGNEKNRWLDPYRHWNFKTNNSEFNPLLTKKR